MLCGLRIFLDRSSLEMLAQLLSSVGADSVVLKEEKDIHLEAIFDASRPFDLVDRVEGWLNGLDREGKAQIQSCDIGGDWKSGWEGIFHGVQVGMFSIRPPWVVESTKGVDICIDPRGGFGSGTHPTTQACLHLLQEKYGDQRALDVGSGSGVLAIAMSKLGWSVSAIEREEAGRNTTIRNAKRNHVHVHMYDDALDTTKTGYALVTANLYGCRGVVGNAELLVHALDREGLLITGGFRPNEARIVTAAFSELKKQRESIVGDWMSISFLRKS